MSRTKSLLTVAILLLVTSGYVAAQKENDKYLNGNPFADLSTSIQENPDAITNNLAAIGDLASTATELSNDISAF